MTKWPPNLVLEALRATAQPVLHSAFRPDCCIAATRIAIEVLKRFGIHGEPKAFVTIAGCRSFVEWQARDPDSTPPPDAYYLITDVEHARDDGFAGHLAVTGKVKGQRFLLDLSAAQMNRPAKKIFVPEPLLVDVPEGWTEDNALKVPLPEGGRLLYSFHPKADIDWTISKDWTVPGYRRAIFNSLVTKIITDVQEHVGRTRSAA